jgi:dihydropyrimidinase
MAPYDPVVRGGKVANAADVLSADIGITNGKIIALGEPLGLDAREIGARSKLVLPGDLQFIIA